MRTIKGDIFNGEWDCMVHCCNIWNTMGAGIAKIVKREYPQAYEVDKALLVGDKNKLGYFSFAYIPEKCVTIFNLYAQVGIGNTGHPLQRNLKYDLLYDGMFRICEYLNQDLYAGDKLILAMPMLGAGLAGGEWEVVEKILESVESHFANIIFNVYKL